MFSTGDAYERFMGRWSRRLADAFVRFAGVQAGDLVLDAGAGTGALASAVLAAANSTRVVGIDPSSAYVEAARRGIADPRATFEQGDVMQLRFKDAAFDKSLSLLVLNFVGDPAEALRQMIRVTRPGGVVAAAVWDYGAGMEMLRFFWDEAVALDSAADARDERHMPLSRPGQLETLWRQGGATAIAESPLIVPLAFPSFDDFWSPFLGGQGPAGAYVTSLAEEQRAALRDRLRERLRADADESVTLRGRAWAVRGTAGAAGR